MTAIGDLASNIRKAQNIAKQFGILSNQKIPAFEKYQKLLEFNGLNRDHPISKLLRCSTKAVCSESPDQSTESELGQLIGVLGNTIPKNTLHNLWIVKPANLSRGRNIKMCSSLSEIWTMIDEAKFKSTTSQWIIQKYIENPFLITGCKFDIRLYVLITSMNPFTLWFYRDYYIRLSPLKYSTEDKNTPSIHLTNFSVSKYVPVSENEVYKERMLSRRQFREYLSASKGLDAADRLESRIKSMLKKMFAGAPAVIAIRPNTFEMLGVDVLIDEELNPWVLEVNASPSMEMGTSVTTEVVTKVSEDLIKIVVDENFGNKDPTKSEIGSFEKLMKYSKNSFDDVTLETITLCAKGSRIAELSLV